MVYMEHFQENMVYMEHFQETAFPLLLISLILNDGGPYLIEINCRTNQWTGFYMIGTSVMKDPAQCCL